MKINGIELEFDFMEVETNKKFEKSAKYIAVKAKDSDEVKKLSRKIEVICGAIKEGFDIIFGNGTGVEVCGEENNLIKCMHAYNELMEEKCRQDKILDAETKKFKELLKNGIPD